MEVTIPVDETKFNRYRETIHSGSYKLQTLLVELEKTCDMSAVQNTAIFTEFREVINIQNLTAMKLSTIIDPSRSWKPRDLARMDDLSKQATDEVVASLNLRMNAQAAMDNDNNATGNSTRDSTTRVGNDGNENRSTERDDHMTDDCGSINNESMIDANNTTASQSILDDEVSQATPLDMTISVGGESHQESFGDTEKTERTQQGCPDSPITAAEVEKAGREGQARPKQDAAIFSSLQHKLCEDTRFCQHLHCTREARTLLLARQD